MLSHPQYHTMELKLVVERSHRKNVDAVHVWSYHFNEDGRRVFRLEKRPVRRSHRRYHKILMPMNTYTGIDGREAVNNIVGLLEYFGEKPKYVSRIDDCMLFGVTKSCVSCLYECGLITCNDVVRMSSKPRAWKYPAYVLDSERAFIVGKFMNMGGLDYATPAWMPPPS